MYYCTVIFIKKEGWENKNGNKIRFEILLAKADARRSIRSKLWEKIVLHISPLTKLALSRNTK